MLYELPRRPETSWPSPNESQQKGRCSFPKRPLLSQDSLDSHFLATVPSTLELLSLRVQKLQLAKPQLLDSRFDFRPVADNHPDQIVRMDHRPRRVLYFARL